jgi:aarF domain-containing kinase
VPSQPLLEWSAGVAEDAPIRKRLAAKGVDTVCQMIFVHNFVHGDLHPGNIFVLEDPSGDADKAQIAFLDAGIAVRYSEADHEHLIDVLTSFIQYDGFEGGRLMAEKSEEASAARDLDGFCAKIQTMVELARDSPTFFDQVSDCISIICEAACDHRVKLQGGFISIALSVKVVEGSVIQVDPRAVVAPRAKPVVVREHIRRKGRNLLGRSTETGELLDEDRRQAEEALVRAARERAAGNFSIRDQFNAKHGPRPAE